MHRRLDALARHVTASVVSAGDYRGTTKQREGAYPNQPVGWGGVGAEIGGVG